MMWATLFAVALMLVVCALMPTVNEVPEHPADLLWRFRISSFGTHLVLWSVIGVAFGALAERTPATRCAAPSLPPRLTHHESVANVDLSGRNSGVRGSHFPCDDPLEAREWQRARQLQSRVARCHPRLDLPGDRRPTNCRSALFTGYPGDGAGGTRLRHLGRSAST